MIMKKKNYYVLSFLLIFVACSGSEDKQIEFKELEFNIDADLLSDVYIDSVHAFQFQPPKAWNRVEPHVLLKLRQKIDLSISDTSIYRISPVQVFYQPTFPCLCALSSFDLGNTAGSFDAFIKGFRKVLETRLTDQTIKHGFFRRNDILVYQILIMDEKNVNFKLVCQGTAAKPFEIDYIVPMSVYESTVKVIESSMGSMKNL